MAEPDKVVLTPSKKGRTSVLKIERVKQLKVDDSSVVHEAGGQHKGLVVNKQAAGDALDETPPQLQLEFKCWLVDKKTGEHVPERRLLKFWFQEDATYLDRVTVAYEFFRELVQPQDFPRDYVGFIKKAMKQMQGEMYTLMRKVDVELTPLTQEEMGEGLPKEDTRTSEEILQEQVLYVLESAYPNVLALDDICRITEADERSVMRILEELRGRDLIQEMENQGGFMRKVYMEGAESGSVQPQMVHQIPVMKRENQPTIAIITSHYYEKLAVDAMMEDKTTYMRFQTQGESNVYTLGYIGNHKVVSTKLPAIGRGRAAKISSGSTTTRLLGTFSEVEHVFLVGTAGGVPHYTDFFKHPRLGDIVVSTPNEKGYVYVYCDKVLQDARTQQISYSLKTYAPKDLMLQEKIGFLKDNHEVNPDLSPWKEYIAQGQNMLKGQEVSFERPSRDSDKLFMSLGGRDLIEVQHPPPPPGSEHVYSPNEPTIRYGTIGSGKTIMRNDASRQEFAYRHGIMVFDNEFDQVLDSVIGNVKYSFALIRSIVDYGDGTKKEWNAYASLAAASYMKSLISLIPGTEED